MKKVIEINTALCDARKVSEETLAGYDEIRINGALLLTSPGSRALLNKYPVNVNVTTALEVDEDAAVSTVHGKHVFRPGGALPQGKCYLIVNGKLEAEPGSEELVKNYAGIIVNGNIICPESMAGLFANAQINGRLETYPDGYIRLDRTAILDRTFHLRAREGAGYYTGGRMVALDAGIDFDALAAKGVRFAAKELVVAESLCGKAAPLFNEDARVTVLPDGCAYVDDDAVLSENLLRRYGDKLYIDGDLTVNAGSGAALEKVAFLKVNGDLRATQAMARVAAGLRAEYDDLQIIADTVLGDRNALTVDRALLEETASLDIEDCGKVTFAEDVPAGLIREKLRRVEDCGKVFCSGEQRAAVEQVARDVGKIIVPGEEEEDKEDAGEEIVRRVNASTYIL